MTKRTGIPCCHIIFLLRMNNQPYSIAFNPRWLLNECDQVGITEDMYKNKVALEEEEKEYIDILNNQG